MATRDQIEKLKADWASDPCWDIEHTEGFEDHSDELKAFAEEKEAEWARLTEEREARRLAKLEQIAEELGCPGNIKLAMNFEYLKNRIEELEAKVDADQEKF